MGLPAEFSLTSETCVNQDSRHGLLSPPPISNKYPISVGFQQPRRLSQEQQLVEKSRGMKASSQTCLANAFLFSCFTMIY